MPITVLCTNCGKQLKVKDEYVGRKLKCPKCDVIFTAEEAETVEAAPKSPAALPTPASRKPAVLPGQEKQPRLHVSKGVIVLVAAAILLPTLFFIWHVGPARVMDAWAKQQPIAELQVQDVVDRIMQSYLSHHAGFNPRKSHAVPHTLEVTFLPSPLYMSMPEKIGFVGTTTQGAFHGQYHLNGEIEADVEVGGMSLPGVMISRGDTTLHGTGREKDGKITAEIDGQPVDLFVPPASDKEE